MIAPYERLRGRLESLDGRAKAFFIIAFFEVMSFGIFLTRTGFYHDDWSLLESWFQSAGVGAFIKSFFWLGFGVRPLNVLQFSLLFAAGGLNPLIYQVFMAALDLLQGWLFFLFIHRLTDRRDLALAAGALAIIFPSHAATHHWVSSSGQTLSIDLVLASMLCFMNWLDTSKRSWLFAALTCYALGLSSYESTAFLPLMLGAGLAARARFSGASTKQAWLGAAKALWPYAVPFLLLMLWQRVGYALVSGAPNARAMGFSFGHFIAAFKAGLGCITYKMIVLCAKTALPALRELGAPLIVLWAAFTAAAAFLLRPAKTKPKAGGGVRRPSGWLIAAGGFAAANLPYALSHDYTPTFAGVMGRTSAVGGLAGGLLCALGLAAVGQGRARAACLALLIGAFTWTNWHTAAQWARSWDLQTDILNKMSARAALLPPSANILLAGFPNYINIGLNEVMVFDATWDFPSALRLKTKRFDLAGDVVSHRTRFEKDFVAKKRGLGIEKEFSYDNLFVYQHDENIWYSDCRGTESKKIACRMKSRP